jgi:hypothetical protein
MAWTRPYRGLPVPGSSVIGAAGADGAAGTLAGPGEATGSVARGAASWGVGWRGWGGNAGATDGADGDSAGRLTVAAGSTATGGTAAEPIAAAAGDVTDVAAAALEGVAALGSELVGAGGADADGRGDAPDALGSLRGSSAALGDSAWLRELAAGSSGRSSRDAGSAAMAPAPMSKAAPPSGSTSPRARPGRGRGGSIASQSRHVHRPSALLKARCGAIG